MGDHKLAELHDLATSNVPYRRTDCSRLVSLPVVVVRGLLRLVVSVNRDHPRRAARFAAIKITSAPELPPSTPPANLARSAPTNRRHPPSSTPVRRLCRSRCRRGRACP